MHYNKGKYSWYNKSNNTTYYWEDKELLQFQRQAGHICVNVEADHQISKKQRMNGPSKALIARVTKNIF